MPTPVFLAGSGKRACLAGSTSLHATGRQDIETTDKISIGGIRFSPDQVQISLSGLQPDTGVLTEILHALTCEQINLSFLCLDTDRQTRVSFCLCREDYGQAAQPVAKRLQPLGLEPGIVPSIGTLTLFPHQSRLRVLGALLAVWGKNNLPLYSMSSSISTLAVNTDYRRLDEAARALQSMFLLPENHAPFRQYRPRGTASEEQTGEEGKSIVETAATWWEPVIGIYGSSKKTKRILATIYFEQDRLAFWGERLQSIDNGCGSFEMALIQRVDNTSLKLSLLYDAALEELYKTVLYDAAPSNVASPVVRTAVELLYFHGPHFQDRYGVADAALRTLQHHRLDIIACGCSGTSIYLVIPENMAGLAAAALAPVFVVPKLS